MSFGRFGSSWALTALCARLFRLWLPGDDHNVVYRPSNDGFQSLKRPRFVSKLVNWQFSKIAILQCANR